MKTPLTTLAGVARALGDPTRLHILQLIARGRACCDSPCCPSEQEEQDGVCTCELVELLDMPQATVSYHLKVLREAGLIRERRIGKWTYYTVDGDAMRASLDRIVEAVLAQEAASRA